MSEIFWSQLQTSIDIDTPLIETKSVDNSTTNIKNKIGDITKKIVLIDYSKTSEVFDTIPEGKLLSPETTKVAEITSTQPTFIEKRKERLTLKKLQARIKEKTVSLEKALDAYGVIDNLIKKNNNYDYNIHARIYDLNNHDLLDEISFSSSEFSKSDQRKLVENAIFYWYVGIEKSLMGQERRVSEFRLRRVFKPQTM